MNILALSGSLRKDSYNTKVLGIAQALAQDAGASVTEADLNAFDLPIYNQDIEDAGIPQSVTKLKTAIEKADILLIASPEYNHSIPGGLKNAIDWATRGGSNSFKGKVIALFGVSPGMFGTVRGQRHTRDILSGLGAYVVPAPQVYIGSAAKAFQDDGSLANEKTHEKLTELITNALDLAKKLAN